MESLELEGRYFVQIRSDDHIDEGRVCKELSSGFFLTEEPIRIGDEFETAFRIRHFVELRDAFFYKDRAQAERHCNPQALEVEPDIDFGSILSIKEEMEDLAFGELKKAREQNQVARAAELEALLRLLINGPA